MPQQQQKFHPGSAICVSVCEGLRYFIGLDALKNIYVLRRHITDYVGDGLRHRWAIQHCMCSYILSSHEVSKTQGQCSKFCKRSENAEAFWHIPCYYNRHVWNCNEHHDPTSVNCGVQAEIRPRCNYSIHKTQSSRLTTSFIPEIVKLNK